MSDENIKLEKLSQENALLRCECAGLRAERDALLAQLTVERHKVFCLREDIRLEREARQIVEEQIEELLKKSQGED